MSKSYRGDLVGSFFLRPVHLIGVPLDLGANRRGTDMGPSAIRIAGLGSRIKGLGHKVVDKGDLPTPTPEIVQRRTNQTKYLSEITQVCRSLYEESLASLTAGAIPLVLGGDHSLAAGSVAASANWAMDVKKRPIGLVWVDAHGDMNTPAMSPSGNVHGMPLAALLGLEPAELGRFGQVHPTISPQLAVLVGIRNLDEREKIQVRESGIHVFTMKDVDREGIATLMETVLHIVGTGTAGIHVSFDMDVCDPAIAPGVGTQVKGGLNYREAHLVMEMIAESGKLASLDIVEVNPTLDVHNTTAELATELALSALGLKII